MRPNLIATASCLFFMISQTNTLNILGIFPYQGKSHFTQFQVYLRELANRGHNVTVVSYFPDKNSLPNYHDIGLGDPKTLEDDFEIRNSYIVVLASAWFLASFANDNCKVLVANEKVQEFVKHKQKFDVIVLEQFNSDCALGIAHKLEAPVVGISSHVLMPFHLNRFGIPNNPAFYPHHFLGGGTKPTLYQRVERVIFDFYFKAVNTYAQWNDQNTLREYFDDIPPLEDLARNIKFQLISQYHVLTGNRLHPPNVIEIGGFHVTEAKPLTGDLKKFVEEAHHGVIYISYGSMIKSTNLNKKSIQSIIDAMKEFPQRFIWKWDDTTILVDKNKVHVSKWLPQVDILAHPKLLLFISHAGMGSITEAIHYSVPMIVSPFFGDQPSNAAAVEESGFGIQLDINDLNKESLVAAIKKALNPEFRTKAMEVARIWHDRPMSPMDTAVFWTEYVARNANFTFRHPAVDIPLYQHWNLDVAAVLFTISFVTLYLIKTVIGYICCRSTNRRTKSLKTDKGKNETKSKGKKRTKRD